MPLSVLLGEAQMRARANEKLDHVVELPLPRIEDNVIIKRILPVDIIEAAQVIGRGAILVAGDLRRLVKRDILPLLDA